MYDATIVTGHGRCGSSVVMQMLQAGGVSVTGGYPAFEDVSYQGRALKDGKAWKCLDIQVPQLAPQRGYYRWIVCTRDNEEQAKSQVKFAQFFGMPMNDDPNTLSKLIGSYKRDTPKMLEVIHQWGGPVLHLEFEMILAEPQKVASALEKFGFENFNVQKAASVVRKRSSNCYEGMLEVELYNSAAA